MEIPGSGKTTIGKYVAYSIASQKFDLIGEHFRNYIPVVVKASEYRTSLQTEPDLHFYCYITQKFTAKFGRLFDWALKRGLCLVTIDGLDEVPEADLRVKISRKIEQFIGEFKENKFLITSRIAGYRQSKLTGDVVHVKLSELEEEQIIDFLKKWFKAIETEAGTELDEKSIEHKASELWDAIESKPGIMKIAGNPLILTIIALTSWHGKKLPNRRVDLYQITTETLIENWPLYMRGSELNSEEILAILGPIAYEIFKSGKDNLITEHDFRPVFEQQICEVRGVTLQEAKLLSREIFGAIETDTGFFLRRGYDEHGQDIYGFWHRTFAEYLTARYLSEEWASGQLELSQYVHDPHWIEVLLLMAGHIGAGHTALVTQLVKKILNLGSAYENLLHRDLLFAADILSDYVRVKRELLDEIVLKLIDIALNTQYIPLWGSILRRLSNIAKVLPLGNKPVTQIQIHPNDTIELKIKKAVMQRMVGEDTDEIFGILFQGLTGTENIRIFLEPFLFGPYLFMKAEDNPTHLIAVQTKRMGSFNRISEQTVNRIKRVNLPYWDLTTLKSHSEQTSIDSWICLVNPEDILKLPIEEIVSLLTSNNWHVSMIVEAALELNKTYISVGDRLVKLFSESHSPINIRLMGLNALTSLILRRPHFRSEFSTSISNWLKIVQELFSSDENPEIRSKALELLMTRQQPENKEEILLQALNNPNEILRLTATKIMRQRALQITPPILNKLKELFINDSPDIRRNCAQALIWSGKTEEGDIIPLLDAAFKQIFALSEIYELSGWLAKLLQLSNKISDFDILDALMSQIKSLIENISNKAKDDLGDIVYFHPLWHSNRIRPHKKIIDELFSLLDSPNPKVRQITISLFPSINPIPITLEQFLSLINDSNPKVRKNAPKVLSLKNIFKPEVLDILFRLLIEDEPDVAKAVVGSLSKIRNQKNSKEIIERVANIVVQYPENNHAYELLWELVVYDDVPF